MTSSIMTTHDVKVRFSFHGVVKVTAKTMQEAVEIVDTNFGMNIGDITTGCFDDEIIDWDFDMIVTKFIDAVTYASNMPEKPIVGYLSSILERFGEYESTTTVFLESKDPEFLKRYARDFRGSDEDDWDAEYEGYWFDGNLVFLPSIIRGITQHEQDIWSIGKALESEFSANILDLPDMREAWDRCNRDI
jgi:hypothetical protein